MNNPSVDTSTAGSHTHDIPLNTVAGGSAIALSYVNNSLSPFFGVSTDSDGAHKHSVTTNVSINSTGGHAHTIAAFNSDSAGVSSVDVTMPYVQLLACRKN